ncbi:hypothetical protein BGX38DRAFT_1328344 [Terfezia claveryi]|nr:hypothetical protein BGX38DRAFT_1328344 [Terfezia claveryi]
MVWFLCHTIATMPRKSEKAQTLDDIDAAVKVSACSCLLVSDVEDEEIEEEVEEEHIEDLLKVQDIIAALRVRKGELGEEKGGVGEGEEGEGVEGSRVVEG